MNETEGVVAIVMLGGGTVLGLAFLVLHQVKAMVALRHKQPENPHEIAALRHEVYQLRQQVSDLMLQIEYQKPVMSPEPVLEQRLTPPEFTPDR
jgi:hypothetical protein